MPKLFNEFSEVKDEIEKKTKKIIYKYRDFNNSYHRRLLTHQELWFSHPKELNDPYDIRLDLRFKYNEINKPEFFEILKLFAPLRYPHVHPDSRDFRILCENQYQLIKQDPKKWMDERSSELRESNLYDKVGVLSLTFNPLNLKMWEQYSNNNTGFCAGFATMTLAEHLMPRGLGFVKYKKRPPIYSFFDRKRIERDEMYLKGIQWKIESEFRFVTPSITSISDRAVTFPKDYLKEVIVGYLISKEDLEFIKKVLVSEYDSNVKLYKIIVSPISQKIKRIELDY